MSDFTLQLPFLSRADLPADILNAMLLNVDPIHHENILARTAAMSDPEIELALAQSDVQFTAVSNQDPGLVAQAYRNAAHLSDRGPAAATELEDLLRKGSGIDFTAAMAHLTRLNYSFVEEILRAPSATGIAVLCRALGFQKTTFSTISLLSNGGRQRSPKQMSDGMSLFPKISPEGAEKVLKFWRHFSTPLKKVEAA